MKEKLIRVTIKTMFIALAFAWFASPLTQAQNRAPLITNFNPNRASPGTIISIIGRNFIGTTAVRFNNLNAQFVVVRSDLIRATVPDRAARGPITVTTQFGTSRSSGFFDPTPPGPVEIQTFLPAGGRVGARVTINGRNFVGVRELRFNGVNANFAVASSTQIIATVPNGATTGPVRVEGTSGIATSRGVFNVLR